MLFLFIILAVCMIFALQFSLQSRGITARGYRLQDDPRRFEKKQTKKYKEPYTKKAKQKHNPLFGPFRGTLDDDHIDIVGNQLIKHQDAEAGYVILNGVKRKIEDCKDL